MVGNANMTTITKIKDHDDVIPAPLQKKCMRYGIMRIVTFSIPLIASSMSIMCTKIHIYEI